MNDNTIPRLPNGTQGRQPRRVTLDWPGIRHRLTLVAEALQLPPSAIEAAAGDRTGEALIDFAFAHDMSLDFLVTGDLAPLIRSYAGRRP